MGGKSDDQLDGGTGADALDRGTGFDVVTYAARAAALRVSLDGAPDDGEASEADNVLPSIDAVVGGNATDVLRAAPRARSRARGARLEGRGGDDTLEGSGAADELRGGGGDDVLTSGDGPDLLVGGAGRDELSAGAGAGIVDARRGGVDDVRCGPGEDSASAAGADTVHSDCELRSDGGPRGGPFGKPAPPATLSSRGSWAAGTAAAMRRCGSRSDCRDAGSCGLR